MNNKLYFDANRMLWDMRTPLHVESNFYDVAAFKAGGSSLCGIEPIEMGSVQGKSILHLQCHFGLCRLRRIRPIFHRLWHQLLQSDSQTSR